MHERVVETLDRRWQQAGVCRGRRRGAATAPPAGRCGRDPTPVGSSAGGTAVAARRHRIRPGAACAPGPGSVRRPAPDGCSQFAFRQLTQRGSDADSGRRVRRNRRRDNGRAPPVRSTAASTQQFPAARIGSRSPGTGWRPRADVDRPSRSAPRCPRPSRPVRPPRRRSAAAGVVEKRGQREHHRRPQRVGDRVEVADLQPTARPHRRKQRGEVVIQVGGGGPSPGQRRAAVGPVRERHPVEDRLRFILIGVVDQHHRCVQRVARPVRGRIVSRWRRGSARNAPNPDRPTPAAGSTAIR